MNINIHEAGGRVHTRLNAAGPRLTARELQQVMDAVERNLPRAALLVISGSLPPGMPADTYADIIRMANRRGVRVILDTDGEPLRQGLRAKPFMVKPNVHEARRARRGGWCKWARRRPLSRAARKARCSRRRTAAGPRARRACRSATTSGRAIVWRERLRWRCHEDTICRKRCDGAWRPGLRTWLVRRRRMVAALARCVGCCRR